MNIVGMIVLLAPFCRLCSIAVSSACSVGWFVSLLVRLCEREVLLASSDEQCFVRGLASPSRTRWRRVVGENATGKSSWPGNLIAVAQLRSLREPRRREGIGTSAWELASARSRRRRRGRGKGTGRGEVGLWEWEGVAV